MFINLLSSPDSDGCLAWIFILAVVLVIYIYSEDSKSKTKTKSDDREKYNKTNSSYLVKQSPPEIKPTGTRSNNNQSSSSELSHSVEEKLKPNWFLFHDIIQKHRIVSLYHFTDSRNLWSINSYGGLYSWRYCLVNGITIPCPGGNTLSRDLDRAKNMDEYIHLSFTPNHPMLFIAQKDGRINKPIIMRIDPSVIYWDSTLFSDRNSAATMANIGGSLDDFLRIEFSIACGSFWSTDDEKSLIQAEVLVKNHIPLKNINF